MISIVFFEKVAAQGDFGLRLAWSGHRASGWITGPHGWFTVEGTMGSEDSIAIGAEAVATGASSIAIGNTALTTLKEILT